MELQVVRAKLAAVSADALIHPGNSEGTMRRGLSDQLRRAGGDEIEAAAIEAAPIAIGAALLTTAGNLPAKFIVHVPIMEAADGSSTSEEVRRATRAALVAAVAKKLNKIALPAIGTHGEGVPVDEMARAIVEELRAHKKDLPAEVLIVDDRPDVIELLEETAGV